MIDSWIQAAGPWLQPWFELLGSPVTGLELLAFVLSLAMVAGNLWVKVWAWPLAIAASACYALLFAASKLYGEAGLQLFFIAVSLWGWWAWWRSARLAGETGRSGLEGPGDPGGRLDDPIHSAQTLGLSWMSPRQRLQAALLTLAAWPALGWLLLRSTDTDVPFADALPTVASVTGQLLLASKRVENWLVWLAVNLISVWLFAYKGLWLTALLYALFAVLSWVGFKAWQRKVLVGG